MLAAYEITLGSVHSVVWFLVVAAGMGLLGAVVAELLVVRGTQRETGDFVLPGRQGRVIRVGSLGSFVLGPAAAMVAAYLFSPVRDVVVGTTTTTKYDVIRLVATSVTAGLASSSFLASVQSKFTATLTAERLSTALASASDALSNVDDHKADPAAVSAQIALAREQIQRVLTP